MTKESQWNKFAFIVGNHIRGYAVPQYGDFPDKTIAKFTPEKIQAKLESYVDRIGKSSRGDEDAKRDCFKLAHFACYLFAILETGDPQNNLDHLNANVVQCCCPPWYRSYTENANDPTKDSLYIRGCGWSCPTHGQIFT